MDSNYDYDTDSDPSNYEEEEFIGNENEEMTEAEWNQYYPIFDSTSEYQFVNKCLTLMHGKLPDYAYFQSNNEIVNFWNELSDEYYPIIYNYLIENEFIDIHPTFDNTVHVMKNSVIDFVFSYFENRV
jgi:hypothetical protein